MSQAHKTPFRPQQNARAEVPTNTRTILQRFRIKFAQKFRETRESGAPHAQGNKNLQIFRGIWEKGVPLNLKIELLPNTVGNFARNVKRFFSLTV